MIAGVLGLFAAVAVAAMTAGGCGDETEARRSAPSTQDAVPTTVAQPRREAKRRGLATDQVYRHTGAGMLSEKVRNHRERLYVPNSESDTVSVIDPDKKKVALLFSRRPPPSRHAVARPQSPLRQQHAGNSLTRIHPRTSKPQGRSVPVDDPYNLYFTPDGRSAIVVAERLQRLDFRDPRPWKLQNSVAAGCVGVDHLDFAADGRRAVASCEFD